MDACYECSQPLENNNYNHVCSDCGALLCSEPCFMEHECDDESDYE